MRKPFRFVALSWLIIFSWVLLMSPFHVWADDGGSADCHSAADVSCEEIANTDSEPAADGTSNETDSDNSSGESDSSDPSDSPTQRIDEDSDEPVTDQQNQQSHKANKKEKPEIHAVNLTVTPEVLKEEGKVKVSASLSDVSVESSAGSVAEGKWIFTIRNTDTKQNVDKKVQKGVVGETAEEWFELDTPGNYVAIVKWQGKWHGAKSEAENRAPFTMEDAAPVLPDTVNVHVEEQYDQDGYFTGMLTVHAGIPGVKEEDELRGKWVITLKYLGTNEVVDRQVFQNSTDSEVTADMITWDEGEYKAVARFVGTYNGEPVKLRGTASYHLEFVLAEGDVQYACKNGKHVVKASLLSGEEVSGQWVIGIYDMEGYAVVDPKVSKGNTQEKSFTAEFDQLEPGTYFVGVTFGGKIDGKPGYFIDDQVEFEVKTDGACAFKPGNGKNDPQQPVKPKEAKKVIDTIKNGGNLPKTATDHPKGMLYGGIITLIGLVALGLVYRRQIAGWFR